MLCGDANPNGNVELFYKGASKKPLKLKDAYRCVGCVGRFHLECILNHFEKEKGHDQARYALMRIKKSTKDRKIIGMCDQGLRATIPVRR